jgi:hypothetical protein
MQRVASPILVCSIYKERMRPHVAWKRHRCEMWAAASPGARRSFGDRIGSKNQRGFCTVVLAAQLTGAA